jgi:hypothetical protein
LRLGFTVTLPPAVSPIASSIPVFTKFPILPVASFFEFAHFEMDFVYAADPAASQDAD